MMIEAKNLSKIYGKVKALSNVSFNLNKGEITGIIGHNGAGKTTLLKIMSGLIKPEKGTIFINGIDIIKDSNELKQISGYLPEESRLYENMTVPDYLHFFGELYGMSQKKILEREEKLLSDLSLVHDDKRTGNLSKGMKRKVAIARSLLHDPQILIYDEPGSGLDPMTTRFIIEYLKELKKSGKTIILSAHNLNQVEEICDKIIIMRRGEVAIDGTITDLREKFGSIKYDIWYKSKTGELLTDSALTVNELNALTQEITDNGGSALRIESRYPSLEEILIKIGN